MPLKRRASEYLLGVAIEAATADHLEDEEDIA